MPIETFADFPIKTAPLSGDFLVGYDVNGEIRTTLSNVINAVIPQVIAAVPTIPTGTIITYGASTAPSGWLPCDGRLLSTTAYSNLYNVIGNTYGAGPGTFNLPDLRGYFVRGWDNGRGVDVIDATYTQSARVVTITTNSPHGLTTGNVVPLTYISGTGVNGAFGVSVVSPTVFTYTASASQTTSGSVVLNGTSRSFGLAESDGLGFHGHTINDPGHNHNISNQTGTGPQWLAFSRNDLNPSAPNDGTGFAQGPNGNDRLFTIINNTTGITINSSGTASETRPKNIALLYCIKT